MQNDKVYNIMQKIYHMNNEETYFNNELQNYKMKIYQNLDTIEFIREKFDRPCNKTTIKKLLSPENGQELEISKLMLEHFNDVYALSMIPYVKLDKTANDLVKMLNDEDEIIELDETINFDETENVSKIDLKKIDYRDSNSIHELAKICVDSIVLENQGPKEIEEAWIKILNEKNFNLDRYFEEVLKPATNLLQLDIHFFAFPEFDAVGTINFYDVLFEDSEVKIENIYKLLEYTSEFHKIVKQYNDEYYNLNSKKNIK